MPSFTNNILCKQLLLGKIKAGRNKNKNNPIPVKTLILGSFMDDILKKIHNRLFFPPLNLVSNSKNSTPPPPQLKSRNKNSLISGKLRELKESSSEVRVEGSWHTSQNNSKDLKQEKAVYRHPLPSLKKKNREVSLPDFFEGSGRREGQLGVESRFGSRRKGGSNHLSGLNGYVQNRIFYYKNIFENLKMCENAP